MRFREATKVCGLECEKCSKILNTNSVNNQVIESQ